MNNRKLLLKDGFSGYSKDFNVDSVQVFKTFDNPITYFGLPHGLELFYGEFENVDSRRRHLLLGTHSRGNEVTFAFCFWLPRHLVVKGITLEDILIALISAFGLKVRIAQNEYFFVKDLRVPFHSKLEHPEQIVSTVGDQNIPCKIHANLRQEYIGSINWIYINYCFAINCNRYLVWLNNIPTELIRIPLSWYDYLQRLVDKLGPNGKTKLKVLKTKKIKEEPHVSETNIDEQTEIEIPSFAKNSFSYILKTINELSDGEKIIVIPDYNYPVPCMFCGSHDISAEHIFPKWMRDYFPDSVVDMGVALASKEERLIDTMKSLISYNKETQYGFTTDEVCISCNSGWMSTLENKVKSILVDDSNRFIESIAELQLTKERKFVLSQWLLLKVLCIMRKSMLPTNIPHETYNNLRVGVLTDGFVFEVFLHDVYDFNFAFNKGIFDDRMLRVSKFDLTLARGLASGYFCITMHVAKFLFRVSFFDESNGLIRKTCIRKTQVIYPFEKIFDHHTIKNENAFWENIEQGNKLTLFNTGIFLTEKQQDES